MLLIRQIFKLFVLFCFVFEVLQADCAFNCEAYDCPCKCIKNKVLCESRNLTEILKFPSHVSYDVADFGNNKIASITRHQFHHHNWRKLEILLLSENSIKEIKDFSFERLQSLDCLFLNSNYIEFLTKQMFVGLKKLRKLYLNKNKIKSISKKTFEAIRQTLELLYLQENEISEIEKGTFSHFRRLRTLDLAKNQISKLDSHFLHASKAVIHLFLGENPWDCNDENVCLSHRVISRVQSENLKLRTRNDWLCVSPQQRALVNMETIVDYINCKTTNDNNYTKSEIAVVDERSNGKNLCSDFKVFSLFEFFYVAYAVLSFLY